MPSFEHESALGNRVAGLDEAGRGPWAGPVVAACVMIDRMRLPANVVNRINDSKMLSRKQREGTFAALADAAANDAVSLGIGQASVAEIDAMNILQASLLAMQRAVAITHPAPEAVLVDGNRAPDVRCPAKCLVGGDALSMSIAAASIVAKVTRDRIMAELARDYPEYGWERNAGYGTREHQTALARHGVTPEHRRSFKPIHNMLIRRGL